MYQHISCCVWQSPALFAKTKSIFKERNTIFWEIITCDTSIIQWTVLTLLYVLLRKIQIHVVWKWLNPLWIFPDQDISNTFLCIEGHVQSMFPWRQVETFLFFKCNKIDTLYTIKMKSYANRFIIMLATGLFWDVHFSYYVLKGHRQAGMNKAFRWFFFFLKKK